MWWLNVANWLTLSPALNIPLRLPSSVFCLFSLHAMQCLYGSPTQVFQLVVHWVPWSAVLWNNFGVVSHFHMSHITSHYQNRCIPGFDHFWCVTITTVRCVPNKTDAVVSCGKGQNMLIQTDPQIWLATERSIMIHNVPSGYVKIAIENDH